MTFELFIDMSKLAHGSFNALLALVFLYQARMGLSIRRGRKRGEPQLKAMRRHRRLGPFLVCMGLLGYCLGVILVYIDKGRVLEYPLHLAAGSLIVLFLLGQYAVSRKIKGPESSWRTPHLAIGVGIVCLYVLQIVIGISVLLG
jgi:FtsH-binding integral membrane protein